MNLKHFLTVALVAMGCSASPSNAQKALRIGTEGAFPPFNYVDANGEPKGFEIELGHAICKAAKLDCSFTAITFDGLIPALKAKKIDAIIASMNITEERQKVISFVGPYYTDPLRFIGRIGSLADVTPEGLAGRSIGVASGTISESYVRDVAGTTARITSYPSLDNALLDLSANRVELVLDSTIVLLESFLKKPEGKGFDYIGPALSDVKHFGVGPGIGVRQNDKVTASALASGLKTVQDSGEFRALSQKYFGRDVSPTNP